MQKFPPSYYKLAQGVLEEDFLSHGTNIEGVIARACQDIQEERRFKEGDLILITDGEDREHTGFPPVDLENVRRFLAERIRLHTIIVGGGENFALKEVSTTYLAPSLGELNLGLG